MSEVANEGTSIKKPVNIDAEENFPPFPEPDDNDFDDDIVEEERKYYKEKFKDLNTVKTQRLHCTACDRHLGSSSCNENRMRAHPMLRTLVCNTCHAFYNSGEFDKGDDGSELYCRWCGQGGQVYCCASCPHVFCARCVKRNLGVSKIKEIESNDDWKCFKCNSRCIWDLRATCWALLRYCDLKNKITHKTENLTLKQAYEKDCLKDYTDCCKSKIKRRERDLRKKEEKKEIENAAKKTANIIPKLPPTIQVRKFASIVPEESLQEKRALKRPASPKNKGIILKNPLQILGSPRLQLSSHMSTAKRPKMSAPIAAIPVKNSFDGNINTYSRIRPKQPSMQIPLVRHNVYNGYNPIMNDKLNLSIESLTQGLDMSAVAAMANAPPTDELLCMPDLPYEPLCEVIEDNNDDDVQCITPAPPAASKTPKTSTPPVLSRVLNNLPDLAPENIIQMTENDVTVNSATGGLKFRVDPQTLSSNKMYRLPDGRVFAINPNPSMPGGYSATIVAVAENSVVKAPPKGATYAAKLSAILPSQSLNNTPPPLKPLRNTESSSSTGKISTKRSMSTQIENEDNVYVGSRPCDMNVPVEWFRYNLIDAIDAIEYTLPRLVKMKKETSTVFLRTRSVNEVRSLHNSLERLLNNTVNRFQEIHKHLNKDFKRYLMRKSNKGQAFKGDDDDDDDVEILAEDDEPIFIDENSSETISNNETQEVDLTSHSSSKDYNSSLEKSMPKSNCSVRSSNENDSESDNKNIDECRRKTLLLDDEISEKNCSEHCGPVLSNNADSENVIPSCSIAVKQRDDKGITTNQCTDRQQEPARIVKIGDMDISKSTEFNVTDINSNKHEDKKDCDNSDPNVMKQKYEINYSNEMEKKCDKNELLNEVKQKYDNYVLNGEAHEANNVSQAKNGDKVETSEKTISTESSDSIKKDMLEECALMKDVSMELEIVDKICIKEENPNRNTCAKDVSVESDEVKELNFNEENRNSKTCDNNVSVESDEVEKMDVTTENPNSNTCANKDVSLKIDEIDKNDINSENLNSNTFSSGGDYDKERENKKSVEDNCKSVQESQIKAELMDALLEDVNISEVDRCLNVVDTV